MCHNKKDNYTQREKLSVSGLYRPDGKPTEDGLVVRPLDAEYTDIISGTYDRGTVDKPYIEARIRCGALYGAFVGDELAGYVGIHDDGHIGMLYVLEAYRGRKIGKALETYMVNYCLELGWIPYGQVELENEVSIKLHEALGMHLSKSPVVWLW